jgi:hypothetical protein
MLYLAVEIRDDVERHCHVVHFPNSSVPIHEPLAPASRLSVLPTINKTTEGLVQLGMKEVTTSWFSFEEQPSQRRKRLVEFFAVEHAGSREIVVQVGIELSLQLFRRIDAIEKNQRILRIPDASLDMVDGIVQLQVPGVDSEGPTSIGLLLGRKFLPFGFRKAAAQDVNLAPSSIEIRLKFSNQRISR